MDIHFINLKLGGAVINSVRNVLSSCGSYPEKCVSHLPRVDSNRADSDLFAKDLELQVLGFSLIQRETTVTLF